MSRTFLLHSVVFSASIALLAACGGGGGATSAPLPQANPLAVGAAQRSVSSSAVEPSVGKYTSLYSFKGGTDGEGAWAGLTYVNGTLYGTTLGGGTGHYGTVFAVNTSGTERVLYSFQGGADGLVPYAGVIDVKGVLYGTTGGGGVNNGGTVFAVSTSGTGRVLHTFGATGATDVADGANPQSGSLTYVNGTLYGTTLHGGASNYGTVFAVSTSGTERVLYSFRGGTDGSSPVAGLTYVNGTLYGTTVYGGVNNGGTVFAVDMSGKESVLHSFGIDGGTADGSLPVAGLTYVNGTLYGTTTRGGAVNNGGTVFAVSTSGKERVLYSFRGGTDGSSPNAGLIYVKGVLYGTTQVGGASNGGTVFAVSTSGKESVLHNFGSGTDGLNPDSGVIDVKGTLYGTTDYGGANGFGTVFRLSL
jgi:uncharacterized repeat protein (TIGR03803 family)